MDNFLSLSKPMQQKQPAIAKLSVALESLLASPAEKRVQTVFAISAYKFYILSWVEEAIRARAESFKRSWLQARREVLFFPILGILSLWAASIIAGILPLPLS
jgi:hypothetical protein